MCDLPDYLKSNMDRFIVIEELLPFIAQLNLKSNMDRFIGRYFIVKQHRIDNLKSNMDRFIVYFSNHLITLEFI